MLKKILSSLVDEICVDLQIRQDILGAISVTKIYLLDSTSLSLQVQAEKDFPAPRKNVV